MCTRAGPRELLRRPPADQEWGGRNAPLRTDGGVLCAEGEATRGSRSPGAAHCNLCCGPSQGRRGLTRRGPGKSSVVAAALSKHVAAGQGVCSGRRARAADLATSLGVPSGRAAGWSCSAGLWASFPPGWRVWRWGQSFSVQQTEARALGRLLCGDGCGQAGDPRAPGWGGFLLGVSV